MAEFKINRSVRLHLFKINQVSARLNENFKAVDRGKIEGSNVTQNFQRFAIKLNELFHLYGNLLIKDSTDIAAMAKKTFNIDVSISSVLSNTGGNALHGSSNGDGFR